ncbi:DUF397 domain-containing protein [Streptomyces sp. NPDC090022]|uniref:DUF397 domain-containing protein n=1 Tax=Streptomyces sp. NPDC090022 TaxID=3365920 RepID=UPI003804588C
MSIEPSHGDFAALKWFKSSYSPSDSNDCVEVAWFKSSYSPSSSNDCVEVAWAKSSHSTNDGPDCVEVARTPERVLVRDSTRPAFAQLALGPAAWSGFVGYAAGQRG